jgi:ABC-type antimicrobial peptide transport system permease subunit
LNIFDFPLIAGDPEALAQPHSVLLTRSYAARLSSEAEITDLLWKSISVVRRQSREDFLIAGIKLLKAVGTTSSSSGILVSCVGLLAIQSLAQRRREVGVRKVLGASTRSIFRLLSSRFLFLTLLGCAAGGALSFLAVPLFPQNMSFRMPLGPQHILPPAVGILLLAVVTIAWHTVATARIDPARELRRE